MRLVLLTLLAVASCVDARHATRPAASSDLLPYTLDAPDAVLPLPAALVEASALTMLPSGRLGMVQDEAGTLYEVDPATGDIVDRLVFDGAGDFEGVELAGDAVWALRSDGDLFHLSRDADGAPTARKVETALRGRHDTEGLGYDAATGRLLIACKEWPGPDLDGVRAIYAFDLATERVSEAPVFLLDRAVVDADDKFRPSALAVHPVTGEIYVLSSVRRAIAVLSPEGALLGVADLPGRDTPQPEGLAFAADGTLYLSSEGTFGAATLLRFSPTR